MTQALANLRSPRLWFRGLGAAFIGGGASALTTDQGLLLAQRMGVDVPTLDLKALGVVFLSSGIVSAAMYLKKSPLPGHADEEENKT